MVRLFSRLCVETGGKSAEDLAILYLGDPNLGARLRRYNGVRDGAKLPAKAFTLRAAHDFTIGFGVNLETISCFILVNPI